MPLGEDAADHELVTAWRAGDGTAGDMLMRRHYASVLRFFELRATAVAPDLTQQTFLACQEGQTSLRDYTSFRAYLFGIARNQLLRHLHHSGRVQRIAEQSSLLGKDANTSLSTVFCRKEEQRLIIQAILSLPVDLSIVVGLFYWEGLGSAEIAEVLEIPQSTVTSRTARARELIRTFVTELSRPGRAREALLADTEGWLRSLPTSG